MSKAIITERHLHDIASAIIAKGGALGPMKPGEMASAISSIPDWRPSPDWPNIRNLLAEDDGHGYENVAYFLYAADRYPTVERSAEYWRTSDGGEYEGKHTHTWVDPDAPYGWVAVYSHSEFSTTVSEMGTSGSSRLLWVCYNSPCTFYPTDCPVLEAVEGDTIKNDPTANRTFQNNQSLRIIKARFSTEGRTACNNLFSNCTVLAEVPDEIDISSCTNATSMFNGCSSIRRVPDVLDTHLCTTCATMFNSCTSLKTVPEVLDLSSCTNCSSMFSGCRALLNVPSTLDLSSCTTCANMFMNCASLKRVPDVLDLSSCTDCSSMFNGCRNLEHVPDTLNLVNATKVTNIFMHCYSLKSVPTHLTVNYSVSFANCPLVSRDSVALFDGGGTIVGGMVYNLNTCPNAGQTLTFHANTKKLFSADEWAAVKSLLSSKNWGCSPA